MYELKEFFFFEVKIILTPDRVFGVRNPIQITFILSSIIKIKKSTMINDEIVFISEIAHFVKKPSLLNQLLWFRFLVKTFL